MSRTRAQDYDQKKDVIKKNSVKLFSTTGYHSASMTQIASVCGVSKGLLYHYYKGKEDLLFDILHTHLLELVEKIEDQNVNDLPPQKRLQHLILILLESYRDSDHEHKIQLYALNTLPLDNQRILRDLERRIVIPFRDAIHLLNKTLTSNPNLLMPTTMSLFGMINWCFMWFRDDGELSREDYAHLVAEIFLNGLGSVNPETLFTKK